MHPYHTMLAPGFQGQHSTPKITVTGELRKRLTCRLLELELALDRDHLHPGDMDELEILRRLITGEQP